MAEAPNDPYAWAELFNKVNAGVDGVSEADRKLYGGFVPKDQEVAFADQTAGYLDLTAEGLRAKAIETLGGPEDVKTLEQRLGTMTTAAQVEHLAGLSVASRAAFLELATLVLIERGTLIDVEGE